MKKLSGIELSLHVIAASLGIYAPWIKFTMDSQILKGHGKWDVSHLCGHGHCFRPSHLVIEMSSTNQRRRDCKGGETCRCGYREGTPKCFGHEECPDTCPVRLRMLLKKKWKNDDWERALDIQEAGGAKAKVRCRVVDPRWYRDLIAYEETLANPIRSSKRKRKANDEPAEEPKKKANTATTRAQRRVSNRKTKLRRH
ncbi:uncharacterized protein J4E84_003841 [Alternaria hordeiaustralica]|uniref:uncharacterized protein n=1 Tax=Alternaria hordeiaustralica TaxID=1187925 RepID=UPI0020C441F9|nr:uncharacterized protein J4E84_003841 [Alternaria hordeiaustralica]KAI4691547.1 hypothetical protein J4E84_003841 [Alternaria hordeiaustralica]